MASNPKAFSGAYQYAAGSPLDQIVNGTHPLPSRHNLLDRAMTLTRKTSVKPGRHLPEEERQGDGYGYALGGEERADGSKAGGSRQRVQDLRAARLSQQQLFQHKDTSPLQTETAGPRSPHSSTLISNAFRDSVASDMSFNSISGPNERLSMAGEWADEGMSEDPDRIAEAVRGLTLRRRQSMDTVRSSEFGEGGKWDRAWGGSDDEDDDYEVLQRHAMANVDIDGTGSHGWGALDHIGREQWQSQEETKRDTRDAPNSASHIHQLPALHDAPRAEHVVSLQRTGHSLAPNQSLSGHGVGPAQVQRRDTMMSMVGDVGRVSPSPSYAESRHQYRGHHHSDSNATISGADTRADKDSHRLSYTSNTSHSNAHVYVWPPTPAGSDRGSSNGDRATSSSGPARNVHRDTLQAYQPAMGQRAMVEYAEEPGESDTSHVVTASPPRGTQPMSPSAALAQPLESPILGQDGMASRKQNMARISSGAGSGHPTGRLPPQPPRSASPSSISSPDMGKNARMERYSDPNRPLTNSALAELGKMRKKAIEEHGGRESMVSDLDVETLRLDGSSGSGGSDGSASRRDSASSLGSFSSDKGRDQRQRRSQASISSTYSDDRSSGGRPYQSPPRPHGRDIQHRSWNGPTRNGEGGQRVESITPAPKRSNTGPDAHLGLQSPDPSVTSSQTTLGQAKSASSMRSDGSSLTFQTPTVEREGKRAGKGAASTSQAERFLTLAISHHESGDLSRSAYYFERSAKVEGGCVVGMCMWGMALREGWGVRKDQKLGFDWIGRAAARAGEMMAGSQGIAKSEAELKAIRSELKLSVYELGKCFCYGWGVKMDKRMALEYFELAAKLGDSDAQAEAGALLAAGKGCKKDLKRAAMYYRMAEAQGYDTVGLSWIHKDKYDPVPAK